MFVWVRKRLPEHLVPHRIRSRYLATGLTRRRAIRHLASLSAAVVVGMTVFMIVDHANGVRRSWGSTRPVLVTTRPVAAGAQILPGDLSVEDVPLALVPADVAPDPTADTDVEVTPAAFTGRRVTNAIGPGEILTNGDLADGDETRLGAVLGMGESAVTIEVRARQPGMERDDRIDVYGPADGGSPSAVPTGGTMSLLSSGARVLSIEDSTVTLVVADTDVAMVLTAADSGRIALVTTG